MGILYIVSSGPGAIEYLTPRARAALEESEYIIGNRFYLEYLKDLINGKEVIFSSMGAEVQRAQRAAELARDHIVSMVSGGDAGVYGMASIVLEVLENGGYDGMVEVIPGVTAATMAASRLGSPLSGDYVTLSLSDLLTPWDVIEKRLELAFQMEVPVALYNPKSRGRPHNLGKALGILSRYRSEDTPIGIVKNASRHGEEVYVTTLADLADNDDLVDMHSIVIIGGAESRVWQVGGDVRGIITPRGYHNKYKY
jgi:precorrin-3B C17-methyltransferase